MGDDGKMRLLPYARWKRLLVMGGAGSVLGVTALVGIGYAVTVVPAPSDTATAGVTRILYSDGSELGRVGTENRISVKLDLVPEKVQLAVLAAEDRGFYTEPGISPKGIARALFTNIRGGGDVRQGGSTITQQYAKNAFLSSERTYTRKVKEVFIALKMTRTVAKSKILEDYLNTIYFGRQASGIQIATKAYFGGDVSDLSVSQGAVLAAVIRSPARLDPIKHPQAAKARWAYVLNGMVEKGWLTPAERAAQVYPFVKQSGAGARNNDLSGPKGHIITQVLDELSQRGFDEARLAQGGLQVRTTIRKDAQRAAEAAVQDVTGSTPAADALQGALVSVKPGTGEVWAYYGGASGTGFDFAENDTVGRQPGSSFKPYVLATALEQGLSLRTRLDGNGPKDFPGLKKPIENFGGASFGRVDLIEATQKSINTAYYELGLEVGPDKVAELAHRAGIPDRAKLADENGGTNGGIALGGYDVQVIDQAVGFATFANGGVPVKPFMVRRVTRGAEVVYDAKSEPGPPAFSPDVAADATFAMQAVVERGTGRGARLDGRRPAAGKTGTTTGNVDAWFVGFTPQLSTAVWLGYATPKKIVIDGVDATGGGFSTRIWKAYTDAALQDQEVLRFPGRANVGTRGGISSEPPATRAPQRSAAPSPTPSAEPAVSPTPAQRPKRPSPLPSPTAASEAPALPPGPLGQSPEPASTPRPS